MDFPVDLCMLDGLNDREVQVVRALIRNSKKELSKVSNDMSGRKVKSACDDGAGMSRQSLPFSNVDVQVSRVGSYFNPPARPISCTDHGWTKFYDPGYALRINTTNIWTPLRPVETTFSSTIARSLLAFGVLSDYITTTVQQPVTTSYYSLFGTKTSVSLGVSRYQCPETMRRNASSGDYYPPMSIEQNSNYNYPYYNPQNYYGQYGNHSKTVLVTSITTMYCSTGSNSNSLQAMANNSTVNTSYSSNFNAAVPSAGFTNTGYGNALTVATTMTTNSGASYNTGQYNNYYDSNLLSVVTTVMTNSGYNTYSNAYYRPQQQQYKHVRPPPGFAPIYNRTQAPYEGPYQYYDPNSGNYYNQAGFMAPAIPCYDPRRPPPGFNARPSIVPRMFNQNQNQNMYPHAEPYVEPSDEEAFLLQSRLTNMYQREQYRNRLQMMQDKYNRFVNATCRQEEARATALASSDYNYYMPNSSRPNRNHRRPNFYPEFKTPKVVQRKDYEYEAQEMESALSYDPENSYCAVTARTSTTITTTRSKTASTTKAVSTYNNVSAMLNDICNLNSDVGTTSISLTQEESRRHKNPNHTHNVRTLTGSNDLSLLKNRYGAAESADFSPIGAHAS